ncbi:hypothetical protein ACSBR2_004966 [Camellia fascicularis]
MTTKLFTNPSPNLSYTDQQLLQLHNQIFLRLKQARKITSSKKPQPLSNWRKLLVSTIMGKKMLH